MTRSPRLLPPSLALFALLAAAALAQTARPPAPEARQAELRQKFASGAAAMRAGHPDQATRDFRAVTQIAPDFPEGFLELGMAQVRTGDLTGAANSIERALALNPRLPNANLFLGLTYHQLNETDKAIASIQRELALNPDHPDALMWLGVLYLGNDQPERAVAPLDRAAELAPKDAAVLDYRGRAHMLVAKKSYRAMYELDPNSWRVHRLQGEIYSDAFQYNDAAREFEKAIALAPTQADLYESLGYEYRKLNRLELAETAFKRELALDPGSIVAMYNVASVQVDRGEAKAAVPLLEQVVAASPAAPAFYYLGRSQADLGQTTPAVSAFERVVRLAPSSEYAERSWYQLGHLYRTLGRPADANRALQEFARLKQRLESEKARANELFSPQHDPAALSQAATPAPRSNVAPMSQSGAPPGAAPPP